MKGRGAKKNLEFNKNQQNLKKNLDVRDYEYLLLPKEEEVLSEKSMVEVLGGAASDVGPR